MSEQMPKRGPGRPPKNATRSTAAVTVETTIVELPYAAIPNAAHVTRRVALQLNGPQARRLNMLLRGLVATGSTLRSGRVVQTPADALRYLIDLECPLEG